MQGSNGLKSPITIPAFKIQKMKSVNYFWDLMKDAHISIKFVEGKVDGGFAWHKRFYEKM